MALNGQDATLHESSWAAKNCKLTLRLHQIVRAGVRAERRKRNLAASDVKGTAHQLTSGVCVTWDDVSLTSFVNI